MKSLSDLTAQCIRCGFCLESCPTFVISGEETESPRGRIYLVRSAEAGALDWHEGVAPHLETCLGCRACETACPSGVRYGEILEQARFKIGGVSWGRRSLLRTLTRPGVLRLQLALGRLWLGKRMPRVLGRMLSADPCEADLPRPQRMLDLPPLENMPEVRGSVALLEGCVMSVLYPRVHQCTIRLLRRVGFETDVIRGLCCGALHAHSGMLEEAHQMVERLRRGIGDSTLIVNSAGCGSWVKDNGLPAKDISEFLLENGLTDVLRESPGLDATITYHDACHLAHGQGIRSAPRELLNAIPRARFVELPESDRCCGSAGIYNLTQPRIARTLLEAKWTNVERTEAGIAVLDNPGCHAWLEQASRESGGAIRVMHLAEVLEFTLLEDTFKGHTLARG